MGDHERVLLVEEWTDTFRTEGCSFEFWQGWKFFMKFHHVGESFLGFFLLLKKILFPCVLEKATSLAQTLRRILSSQDWWKCLVKIKDENKFLNFLASMIQTIIFDRFRFFSYHNSLFGHFTKKTFYRLSEFFSFNINKMKSLSVLCYESMTVTLTITLKFHLSFAKIKNLLFVRPSNGRTRETNRF